MFEPTCPSPTYKPRYETGTRYQMRGEPRYPAPYKGFVESLVK
jgi:hypothetical protein